MGRGHYTRETDSFSAYQSARANRGRPPPENRTLRWNCTAGEALSEISISFKRQAPIIGDCNVEMLQQSAMASPYRGWRAYRGAGRKSKVPSAAECEETVIDETMGGPPSPFCLLPLRRGNHQPTREICA